MAARASAAATVTPTEDNVLVGKKGRAGGGGDGGPTPAEQLQVTVYRATLIAAAIGWWIAYTLDFFMTSGISIIDGSIQASALQVADVCAGIAAMTAPTGSAVAAGYLLKLLGAAAASGALGAIGPGALATAAGPACVVLICAREIFWFGLAYKLDAAVGVLVFTAIALLRATAGAAPGGAMPPVPPPLPPDALEAPLLDIGDISGEVLPVGPPVPLAFVASVSLTVVAFSKVFEPIGEDLDEDGEQWAKRSSRPLFDYDPASEAEGDGEGNGSAGSR